MVISFLKVVFFRSPPVQPQAYLANWMQPFVPETIELHTHRTKKYVYSLASSVWSLTSLQGTAERTCYKSYGVRTVSAHLSGG